MDIIKDFFEKEKIEFYAIVPINAVRIINEKKAREIEGMKSVAVFLIPYKTPLPEGRNVGRFAVPYDYHLYAAELFERFKSECGECRCYCDNSPIDEKEIAAKTGLGVMGDNSLIINKKYGSYVFIGDIFLPYEFEEYSELSEIHGCIRCGKCKEACPCRFEFERCVSYINQKKNITPDEENVIRKSTVKWGCDICQDVCPMNEEAQNTPIDFFNVNLAPVITEEIIDNMIINGTFKSRAYAWRGEKTVKRNLSL